MIKTHILPNSVRFESPTHHVVILRPSRAACLHIMITDPEGYACTIDVDLLTHYIDEARKVLPPPT